jgi:Flp pilus assembly protein TadD
MLMLEEINAAMHEERWHDAIPLLVEHLEAHPSHASAHARLGMCFFQIGDFGSATAALDKAVILDPEDWRAGKLLAQAYDRLLRFPEALEVVHRTLKVRPSDPGLLRMRTSLQRHVPEQITDAWELTTHLDHYEVELTNQD